MNTKTTRDSRLMYAVPLTMAYIIINLLVMKRHENGSAEALIYMTGFKLSDLWNFGSVGAANLRGNGFPILTSLLLAPLKGAGLSFASSGMLSLVFMAAAVFIFVLRAPFHMAIGVILVLSPVTGYFLGAQLTPFAIAAFLIVVLAALYPMRRRLWIPYMLLLALLFQTHITLWGFAAALVFTDLAINILVGDRNPEMRSREGRLRVYVPFMLPLASMGFSLYLLSNSNLSLHFKSLKHFVRSVVRVALTLMGQACGLGLVIQWFLILCLAFALLHVFFNLWMPWQSFIFCFGVVMQGLASYMVGNIPVQSGMVTFFMTVWFVWIVLGYNQDAAAIHPQSGASSGLVELQIFIAILFLLPAIGYFGVISKDFGRLYSDAGNAAAEIRNIAGDDLIVTADSRYTLSIAAADPSLKIADMVHGGELGGLLFGEMKTDGKVSTKTPALDSYTELTEKMVLRGLTSPGTTWYLLTTKTSVLGDIAIWSTVMEKVYETLPETISQETYCLYKIKA